MRVPGLKRLKLSARWLRGRFGLSALILGYHRVSNPAHDAFELSISPSNFEEQLQVLRDIAQPISLASLAAGLESGELPARAVAITLDDGYADTLEHAKPLLERYRIPATVFVVAGNLGREFWWDELERVLMSPAELPPTLRLTIDQQHFEWRIGGGSDGKARARLVNSLHRLFHVLPEVDRRRYVERLRNWAGCQSDREPTCRALTSDELAELSAGGLVEVGAHSMTHPFLSSLSVEQQQVEIWQSKKCLETVTGKAVFGFSYPGGSNSSVSQGIVREAGYYFGCASDNDVARIGSDLFCLPRFWVPNWDGMAFSRWLRRWL